MLLVFYDFAYVTSTRLLEKENDFEETENNKNLILSYLQCYTLDCRLCIETVSDCRVFSYESLSDH